MAPTIQEYLKLSNLQMAAEAFLVNPDGSRKADIPGALKEGNGHASRFTATQAAAFAGQWEVLDQRANTSTGFSGTLFKAIKDDTALGIKKDDLVLSFRSTEFIDDAARDNEATNTQEIFKFGFAFGQLSDMEAWYVELAKEGGPLHGKTFSVTGYSLGGHLATAFNLMHPGVADRVVTFNGAGVGKVGNGSLEDTYDKLPRMVARFQELRDQARDTGGLEAIFTSPEALAVYRAIKRLIAANGGVPTAAMDSAIPRSDWESLSAVAKQELIRLGDALAAAVQVAKEAARVPLVPSGAVDAGGKPITPVNVPTTEIAADSLDYQLAVRLAAEEFGAAPLNILKSGANIWFGKTPGAGAPLGNQWDLVGTETTSVPTGMVANSQFHYGNAATVFIEDQPLYRSDVPALESLRHFPNAGAKLLLPNFNQNDFGDTHSLVLIVDSLSVHNLLQTLVPDALPSQIETFFKAASAARAESSAGTQGKAEGDVLENVLNGLGKLILGPGAPQLSASLDGNTWAAPAARDAFYGALEAIAGDPKFRDLQGKLTLSLPDAGLANAARTDFAAFLTLLTASPVAVKAKAGQESAVAGILGPIWSGTGSAAVFADWQADQALTAAERVAGQGTYTDRYLAERSLLLTYLGNRNLKNETGITVDKGRADNLNFRDVDTGARFQVDHTTNTPLPDQRRDVLFGGKGNDTLTGHPQNDDLYGGAGDDSLSGAAGADYLEGNAGGDSLDGVSGSDKLQGDDRKTPCRYHGDGALARSCNHWRLAA